MTAGYLNLVYPGDQFLCPRGIFLKLLSVFRPEMIVQGRNIVKDEEAEKQYDNGGGIPVPGENGIASDPEEVAKIVDVHAVF